MSTPLLVECARLKAVTFPCNSSPKILVISFSPSMLLRRSWRLSQSIVGFKLPLQYRSLRVHPMNSPL